MSGLHVLLVDDDDLMLRIMEQPLRQLDTEPKVGSVATAQTPDDALRQVADAPLDAPLVVISDFNLKASRNGIDVLREAARARPDSVRILLSGYAAEQIGDVTGAGVVHGFLEKPLRVKELYAPLAAIIRRALTKA